MRTPVSLPARARLRFALLALLVAASACDNSSEPELVPAPEFRPCIDYGESLRPTGSILLDGSAYDLLAADGFLYVALLNKVHILDLSDQDAPVSASTIDAQAAHLALAEGGLLCAAANRRLTVIDVNNPKAPIIEDTIELPLIIDDLVTDRNRIYVVGGGRGVWVIDLSVPSELRVIGSVDTKYRAHAIDISGHHALVSCGDDGQSLGLQVLDISDPSSPQRVGFLEGVFGQSVEIERQTAFLCGLSFQTFVIDISNPVSPTVLSTFPSGFKEIVAAGDRAFTCGESFGVHSIINPASPVLLATIETRSDRMAIDGDRVYLSEDEGGRSLISIVDISNPRSPQPLARINLQTSTRRMASRDDTVYLCCSSSLIVLDVKSQMPISKERIPMRAFDAALDGPRAYIASLEEGLTIVELEGAEAGEVSGRMDLPGFSIGIATANGRAYVATDHLGLWIVDVKDPSQCRIMGSVDTPGSATDVAIRDTFAFVTDSVAGLIVMDVTNPYSPRMISTTGHPTFRDATAVALHGDYAYVAARSGGLGIFDISRPSKPDFFISIASYGIWRDIMVDWPFVYLVGEEMLVIDATNPRIPVITGSAPSYFGTGGVCEGDRVFLAQDGGVTVYPRQCEDIEGNHR